jgi:hypothetical protein
MSNEALIRKQLEDSLDLTNLDDALRADEVVMLLIDTSGSMNEPVDYNAVPRVKRIDALRQVVAEIKSAGHVPMIAFGGPYDCQVRFVDAVPDPDGGTPLHAAIPMAKTYGANRLVVISDGQPDLPGECEEQARTFGGKIDVVFVGSAGVGEEFLATIAKLSGGTYGVGNLKDIKQLSRGIIGLLAGDVDETAPIQGPGFTTVEAVDGDEADEDEDFEDEDEEDDDDADA